MPKPTKPQRARNRRTTVVTKNTKTSTSGPASQKADDKVRDALRRTDGATAAEIALAASVGGSTAHRVLAALSKAGTVIRIATDGARTPDRWKLAASAHDTPADEANDNSCADADGTTIRDAVADPPVSAREREKPRWIEPAVAGRKPRLARGALRGMVEDYLRDHPNNQFTPGEIGRKLGHSPGAIANAIETLTEAGTAIRTADRPKTYQLAGREADSATEAAAPTDG